MYLFIHAFFGMVKILNRDWIKYMIYKNNKNIDTKNLLKELLNKKKLMDF
jgi:hypothetical protein